jgi:hypothetical protein
VAERFGKRPSDLLRGGLTDLLLDMHVANLLTREDRRAVRRAERRRKL